jgi:hypothetical protein
MIADDPGEKAGQCGHVEHDEEEEGRQVKRGVNPVTSKVLHLFSRKKKKRNKEA